MLELYVSIVNYGTWVKVQDGPYATAAPVECSLTSLVAVPAATPASPTTMQILQHHARSARMDFTLPLLVRLESAAVSARMEPNNDV